MVAPEIDFNKTSRPTADNVRDDRYQWEFRRIPSEIKFDGQEDYPSPFREAAIFVVHGVGEQAYAETAAALRWGIEEAVPVVEPQHWDPKQKNNWVVPEPYIWDAFWARYYDFEWLEPDAGRLLTPQALEYFNRLWPARALGAFKSVCWLFKQGVQLLRRGRWSRKPIYLVLTVLIPSIFLLMLPHPKSRRFLVGYVNDARLYTSPKGDIEHHIVQRIEHSIGEQFLKLLGLDWNFEPLPLRYQILAGGKRHTFKRITWVAHSLGSVISYNVISDLLHKCDHLRKTGDAANTAKAKRVEEGLQNFVTIGSPLDKIAFLFAPAKRRGDDTQSPDANTVLRRWPSGYSTELEKKRPRSVPFWHNFYYSTDPISGPLDTFRENNGKCEVQNLHTRGWRLPLYSHVAYWRDARVTAKILELCFLGFTKQAETTESSESYPAGMWSESTGRALFFLGHAFLFLVLVAIPLLLWQYKNNIAKVLWEFIT